MRPNGDGCLSVNISSVQVTFSPFTSSSSSAPRLLLTSAIHSLPLHAHFPSLSVSVTSILRFQIVQSRSPLIFEARGSEVRFHHEPKEELPDEFFLSSLMLTTSPTTERSDDGDTKPLLRTERRSGTGFELAGGI